MHAAKDMGFKMSPPAYLSLNSSIKMETNFTGVNYASAGAGIQIIMVTPEYMLKCKFNHNINCECCHGNGIKKW
jgi:hypothetical protein